MILRFLVTRTGEAGFGFAAAFFGAAFFGAAFFGVAFGAGVLRSRPLAGSGSALGVLVLTLFGETPVSDSG